MESKTLATVLIVIICLMLFPVAIGVVAGVFGVIGGVIGGIFGIVTGVFGAFFGLVGAIFGALFGWANFEPWGWGNLFGGHALGAVILVLVIILVTRRDNRRKAKP